MARRAVVVAVLTLLIGVAAVVLTWPTFAIERALRSVPMGTAGARLVEDVTRGGRVCWGGSCPDRLRVWSTDLPVVEQCFLIRSWARAEDGTVEELDVGDGGLARCGWIVSDGTVRLGVVVEDRRPGSDVVLTVRTDG